MDLFYFHPLILILNIQLTGATAPYNVLYFILEDVAQGIISKLVSQRDLQKKGCYSTRLAALTGDKTSGPHYHMPIANSLYCKCIP